MSGVEYSNILVERRGGVVRGHAGEGQNRAAVALLLRRRRRSLRGGDPAGEGERASGQGGEEITVTVHLISEAGGAARSWPRSHRS